MWDTRVAIHQPQFLPYPGFFHKLSLVDTLVVMDDVQYDKRFTNRNRILAPQGPIWLSVPIEKSQKFSSNMEVRINNGLPWMEEHWKRIAYSYRNSAHFGLYAPYFEALYGREHRFIAELDIETTRQAMEWLGLETMVVLESDLGVKGAGTERLVNACAALGADTYVSGAGGKSYMDERLFGARGIRLEYQRYAPRPYRQRFVSEFVPDLSVLDLLFNAGPESGKLVRESGDAAPPVLEEQGRPSSIA
ncbi:MAG: WbqC family protein [Nitrososphaerota archaeon]|nr:WbqC family protein [Nitrososphaerota archaeon]MDG6990688.1 WbqC family protein [Nitrososphaerota archaeon]